MRLGCGHSIGRVPIDAVLARGVLRSYLTLADPGGAAAVARAQELGLDAL
jgi:hypothetical protein